MAHPYQRHDRFISRNDREREAALRGQYRPVALGAVAAAKCIRARTDAPTASTVPAVLDCERDSD